MLTRLYGCVTVRAGFLHPSGGGYAPFLPPKTPLRSTCTGEPASGAVPVILWLAGVRT